MECGKIGGGESLQQAQFCRARNRLDAVRYVQLAVNIVDMGFHRTQGDDHLGGNFAVLQPGGDIVKDFQFPFTQRFNQGLVCFGNEARSGLGGRLERF